LEISLFYICVYDLCTVFQHGFNGHCDYVIMGVSERWVLSAIDFYYAFNQNGYFTIRDNIIAIYDMGTIRMHFSNITKLVSVKIYFNTLYNWWILSCHVFQPYLSFNSTESVQFQIETN